MHAVRLAVVASCRLLLLLRSYDGGGGDLMGSRFHAKMIRGSLRLRRASERRRNAWKPNPPPICGECA